MHSTTRENGSFATSASIGTVEDWRDDAEEFPAAATGSPMDDWEGENWLDVSNEVRTVSQVYILFLHCCLVESLRTLSSVLAQAGQNAFHASIACGTQYSVRVSIDVI